MRLARGHRHRPAQQPNLYPALMRLDSAGSYAGIVVGTTDSNRKARFYALTPAGKRQLADERQAWDRMASIMQTVLKGDA